MIAEWPQSLALGITHAALEAWEENRQEQIAAEQAKLRAHVRTGVYRGTVTRTIRGLQRELPRAETLCGGEATSKDHTAIGARQIIRDAAEPWLSDMCPACRAKVEAAGTKNLSHLSHARGSASARQVNYLRLLLKEAFSRQFSSSYDYNRVDGLSAREASAEIDRLKTAKARGWK